MKDLKMRRLMYLMYWMMGLTAVIWFGVYGPIIILTRGWVNGTLTLLAPLLAPLIPMAGAEMIVWLEWLENRKYKEGSAERKAIEAWYQANVRQPGLLGFFVWQLERGLPPIEIAELIKINRLALLPNALSVLNMRTRYSLYFHMIQGKSELEILELRHELGLDRF